MKLLFLINYVSIYIINEFSKSESVGSDFDNQVNYYKELIERGQNEWKAWKYPTRNTQFENYDKSTKLYYGKYDFIIIGAGSAGAVLANRLSAHEQWKILLLEAGGDETEFGIIPRMYYYNLRSRTNWGYRTVPQKNGCKGSYNRQCDYPRGKSLGGSSSNNAMLYVRGSSDDFDAWSKIINDEIWSYKNVLPYFNKLETALAPGSNTTYRGHKGPIYATCSEPLSNFTKYTIQANNELNKNTLDYNGQFERGASCMQSSIKAGKRDSTNQGYLQPIIDKRKNLHVMKYALVTKIRFRGKQAVGVEFIYKNKTYYALRKKEVIVSAGSLNTPQLLMLSGIGPKRELKKFNIPIISDLPVGKYLKDHLMTIVYITTNATEPSIDFNNQVREFLKGSGVLADMGIQGVSFNSQVESSNSPDLEFAYAYPGPYFDTDVLLKNFNLDPSITQNAFVNSRDNWIAISIVLLHPESFGSVQLNTSDPLNFPLTDPNYLTHANDLPAYYEGIKYIQRLLNTPTLRRINGSLYEPGITECLRLKPNMRLFWYCVFEHMATTIYHPMGTCRMGLDERTSVVNKNLEIHGLKHIRIIDASIIPKVTSGHPNAATIMIGEKMSDVIIKKYIRQNV